MYLSLRCDVGAIMEFESLYRIKTKVRGGFEPDNLLNLHIVSLPF